MQNKKNKIISVYLILLILSFLLLLASSRLVFASSDPFDLADFQNAENKKLVALTFDDGPHYKYTPMILDILKKYNSKATFFVIGDRINYTPDILIRMKDEGHCIGNHTFSHSELLSLSSERIRSEIKKANNKIYEITGEKPTLMRPPLGNHDKRTNKVISDEGMSTILWNIDTADWRCQNASTIYKHVIKNINDGDIILMHDFYESTVEATEKILEKLTKDGYEFVTVKALLEADSGICPGKIYHSQKVSK